MSIDFTAELQDKIWQLIGGQEVRPKLFKMNDARRFLLEVSDDNPKVVGCVLSVTPEKNKFRVVMLMIDRTGNLIQNGKTTYLGRQIVANEIDDSVIEFLNGATHKTLMLNHL